MEKKPYLIFQLGDSLYGLDALSVQEIFLLPELTPIAEAPDDIIGMINLRGNIVSVMDLNLRFGYQSSPYKVTDSVIILAEETAPIGILVNLVKEVQMIDINSIQTSFNYGREFYQKSPQNLHKFIKGITQIESGLVMILDEVSILHYSELKDEELEESLKGIIRLEKEESFASKNPEENYHYGEKKRLLEPRLFCPHATPEERTVFRDRAYNLSREEDSQDFIHNRVSLSIIALNGEYFGLSLELVREFTEIRKVTPVPCTPPHLVGNMNLRGEILTLIDIRTLLNMPINSVENLSKAIVVQVNNIVAGIVVDEVLDVMYLNSQEITLIPSALHYTNDEYLRGTAPFREKMMSILDLQKMLTKGGLMVDEEIA